MQKAWILIIIIIIQKDVVDFHCVRKLFGNSFFLMAQCDFLIKCIVDDINNIIEDNDDLFGIKNIYLLIVIIVFSI